jgi:hypothetical protein
MSEKDYYLNPKIKKANLKEEYTKEQVEEYIRCSQDPVYFIEKYVKINTLDHGLQPFKLRGYQRKLIETYKNDLRVILLSARQSGKTTTTAAFILWYVCFTPDKTVAILANRKATAIEILSRILLMLEELPFFLQPGAKVLNRGSVEFANNSRIVADATTSKSIRGYSINFLYLDEFAHVPNAVEFFTSSYPTITSGKTSKIIISSTPNGLNLFYSLWNEAVKNKNGFTPVKVDWWEVEGRDEEWKRQQVSILGEDGFAQEYGNEFIGSSNTLIRPSVLKSLTSVEKYEKINEDLMIIEEPKKDHFYIACIDVSRGVGRDYSTIIVVDVTEFPLQIVATYRSNKISPLVFPDEIFRICKKYNNAFALIERNANGMDVAEILYNDLEYEEIFSTKTKQKMGQILTFGKGKNKYLGVEMTKSVKRRGCSLFKTLVEEQKIVNWTDDILLELYNFVKKGDSFSADVDSHDDLITPLILLSWAINEEYFKELINKDIRQELLKEKEEPIIPFFFENGQEKDDGIVIERWNF